MADLSQEEWAEKLKNDSNSFLLDVRTPEEVETQTQRGLKKKAKKLTNKKNVQSRKNRVNKLQKKKLNPKKKPVKDVEQKKRPVKTMAT